MRALIRPLVMLGAVLCLLSSVQTFPAHAQTLQEVTPPVISDTGAAPDTPPVYTVHKTTAHKTTHHKKAIHRVSKKHKTVKKSKGDPKLRDAQTHLANLGYYKAKVDGLTGPKTRAAIKKFQHDHKLRGIGKLTKETYNAIIAADMGTLPPSALLEMPNGKPVPRPGGGAEPLISENVPPAPDFYATHPDFYGYTNQSYENPVLLGPTQTLSNRFAKIELTEDTGQQELKRYNITLNGLPLILVDGQPSVIGVSRTFALGDEDVVIFTSYRDHDPVCAYAYNLLALNASGSHSYTIHNCTRGYQAKIANGSLFITFPESDDGRAAGNTWRYEKGDLEKL